MSLIQTKTIKVLKLDFDTGCSTLLRTIYDDILYFIEDKFAYVDPHDTD